MNKENKNSAKINGKTLDKADKMLYLCKWKFEGRKTLPKTSAFTRGGQKTEEEFYRRRVKYHQHFSTLFSPLAVIISLADRWPSPALVISRAVAMRHAGALPVLYGLLVPWGRGLLRPSRACSCAKRPQPVSKRTNSKTNIKTNLKTSNQL